MTSERAKMAVGIQTMFPSGIIPPLPVIEISKLTAKFVSQTANLTEFSNYKLNKQNKKTRRAEKNQ